MMNYLKNLIYLQNLSKTKKKTKSKNKTNYKTVLLTIAFYRITCILIKSICIYLLGNAFPKNLILYRENYRAEI